MNQNGDLRNLAGQLREKTQKTLEMTEELIQDTLKTMSENLQNQLTEEQNTINNVISENTTHMIDRMNQESQLLNWSFVKAWIRSAIIGIALSIGMFIALWLTVNWLAETVSVNIRQLHNLEEMVAEQEETLEILRKETLGVTLLEQDNERYIVIPKGVATKKLMHQNGQEFLKMEY